jgi:hypothetical protein
MPAESVCVCFVTEDTDKIILNDIYLQEIRIIEVKTECFYAKSGSFGSHCHIVLITSVGLADRRMLSMITSTVFVFRKISAF